MSFFDRSISKHMIVCFLLWTKKYFIAFYFWLYGNTLPFTFHCYILCARCINLIHNGEVVCVCVHIWSLKLLTDYNEIWYWGVWMKHFRMNLVFSHIYIYLSVLNIFLHKAQIEVDQISLKHIDVGLLCRNTMWTCR